MLTETAYAKINLALHVRRRRGDGYHDIETIFAFCKDGDIVSAELADTISLTIDGPFGHGLSTGEDNLVLQAALGFQTAAGVSKGARIQLTKLLPIASGVGGGSADAAATLRLLARLWDVSPPGEMIADLALSLGADVPACLESRAMRGAGVGEMLTPLAGSFAKTPVLLVNPNVAVSTAAVFRGWNGIDLGALPQIDYPTEFDYTYDGVPGEARATLSPPSTRNDLFEPALMLAPAIGDVLLALYDQSDVLMTRMSGSGATCFAVLADNEARAAAEVAIRDAHPGWWTMASQLR